MPDKALFSKDEKLMVNAEFEIIFNLYLLIINSIGTTKLLISCLFLHYQASKTIHYYQIKEQGYGKQKLYLKLGTS